MSRPRIDRGIDLRAAAGVGTLFVVLAWVFATADLGPAAGFGDASVTEALGYAILGIADRALVTESFLVAFIVLAVVLDAALSGAVHLARREGL